MIRETGGGGGGGGKTKVVAHVNLSKPFHFTVDIFSAP